MVRESPLQSDDCLPVVRMRPAWAKSLRWVGGLMLYGLLASELFLVSLGCGSTKSYTATDQLLLSDAVDVTIAKLDFSPLEGQKTYLDITYLKTQRSSVLVDSDYVISAIRQQMVSAGVLLVENRDEADLVAEARIGALGLDGHAVSYGVPASNALASASSVFVNSPPIPAIPELSFARHESKVGAAKLAVFAYDRLSREPVWQSGIARSSSNAKDTWVLGVGPFQRGTIYDTTRFAGDKITGADIIEQPPVDIRESVEFRDYRERKVFPALFSKPAEEDESAVKTASAEQVGSGDATGSANDKSAAASTGK